MKRSASAVTYSYVFGPGEVVTMSYPPYQTPPYYQTPTHGYETPPYATVWTSLNAAIETGPIDLTRPLARVDTVCHWIEQLVWRELGQSLVEAEEKDKHRTRFAVRVDDPVAALIMAAIDLKAKKVLHPKGRKRTPPVKRRKAK
jgi:hypothetical protein